MYIIYLIIASLSPTAYGKAFDALPKPIDDLSKNKDVERTSSLEKLFGGVNNEEIEKTLHEKAALMHVEMPVDHIKKTDDEKPSLVNNLEDSHESFDLLPVQPYTGPLMYIAKAIISLVECIKERKQNIDSVDVNTIKLSGYNEHINNYFEWMYEALLEYVSCAMKEKALGDVSDRHGNNIIKNEDYFAKCLWGVFSDYATYAMEKAAIYDDSCYDYTIDDDYEYITIDDDDYE